MTVLENVGRASYLIEGGLAPPITNVVDQFVGAFLFVITAKCEGTQIMEFTAVAEIPW